MCSWSWVRDSRELMASAMSSRGSSCGRLRDTKRREFQASSNHRGASGENTIELSIPLTRMVGTARTCVRDHRSGTMATAPALTSPSIDRQGKALPVFRKFGTQRSLITAQSAVRPNACAFEALTNTNATTARMENAHVWMQRRPRIRIDAGAVNLPAERRRRLRPLVG